MTDTKQPEALPLIEALEDAIYEWSGYVTADDAPRTLTQHTTPHIKELAAELRRLHAENTTLQQGYDAARLEIEARNKQLVKEAARTAEEKLRADRMTEQHRMQCQMREGLEREIDNLKLQLAQRGGVKWQCGPQATAFGGCPECGSKQCVARSCAMRAQAAPAAVTTQEEPAFIDSTPELHVGGSAFESWYSEYLLNAPVHQPMKQRARDAYAAGMGDPLVVAAPAAVAAPVVGNLVEELDKIYAVYQRSMGKPKPDAEMAAVVEMTKNMLLSWWGEHREEIRAAMVAALNAKAAPVAQGDALPREDFAWLVVQEACETEPADEDDPECIRILRRDLKSAVLAAFLRHDAARAQAKEGQSHD